LYVYHLIENLRPRVCAWFNLSAIYYGGQMEYEMNMRVILTEMPLDYPLVHRWPVAPGIRLDGEFLRYDKLPHDPTELRLAKRPNSRLLYDFVDLEYAPAEQIQEYAKKWGVLGLCRHGVPSGYPYGFHLDVPEPTDTRRRYVLTPSLGGPEFVAEEILEIPLIPPGEFVCRETRREPLERWRALACVFGGHIDNLERSRTNPGIVRMVAAHANQLAATFGHLRPVVVPAGRAFTLRLAGSLANAGLAAALAYQLMVLVTGRGGWLICAECGRWFDPDKRRSPDRNAYCPKCGRAAAMRAASREYYKRKVQNKNGKETQRG
jgi:hypothetical protein